MSDVINYLDKMQRLTSWLKDFSDEFDSFGRGNFGFHIEHIAKTHKLLFERFSPYKIGDRVMLTKSFEKNDRNTGWHHCAHFLKKGAVGTVRARAYGEKGFTFDIEFDDESYIERTTGNVVKIKANRRHVFGFSEDKLAFAYEADDSCPKDQGASEFFENSRYHYGIDILQNSER